MAIDSKQRKRIRWRMRLAAIAIGFLPLVCCELLLQMLDVPKSAVIDPYVDLHHLKPLFQLDEREAVYRIAPERLRLFRLAAFSARKASGTFRIFALGGSTTQGEPFSTETAFPEWLRLNLSARYPKVNFEVINCGGLSYASYRVLAILREVLEYEPDLIVVYTGQNEFLERRSYAAVQSQSLFRTSLAKLAELRTVRWVQQLISTSSSTSSHRRSHSREVAEQDPQRKSKTEIAAEVDALLDYSGGLEDYHRDDPWREPVVEHFRWNVERMIASCSERGVPLVLCQPVTNLRDCPPFKFESDQSLDSEQLANFEAAWEAARTADQPAEALRAIEQGLAIDPGHAGALYLHGRLLFEAGDWEGSRKQLIAARDADVCPLRALSSIAQAISRLTEQHQVPLLDVAKLFADRSPHGIVGNEWLVDHVHPTVEGHQLIGETLAQLCVDRSILKLRHTEDRLSEGAVESSPAADWIERREELYREHFLNLGEDYFHRGKQRLEGLMLWTQGRAKKIREP